jgi:hypothetical protein
MDNLLNPDVIKAAASSPLGLLSLMCLLIGIVSLGLFRKAPTWAKLVVFVLLLAGVFGFGASVVRQQNPQPEGTPEASRDFVVGRWQVEQTVGDAEGGTFVDYASDGRFTGKQEAFMNGAGRRESVSGTWDLTKVAKDQFRLQLKFDGGTQWSSTFRILDRDHIHNLDQNYVAVRVVR